MFSSTYLHLASLASTLRSVFPCCRRYKALQTLLLGTSVSSMMSESEEEEMSVEYMEEDDSSQDEGFSSQEGDMPI